MKAIALTIVTALSLALAQSAYSTFSLGTIDVDFNGSVTPSAGAMDAAVIGSSGDAWNVISGNTASNVALNLTTGVSSGVTLSMGFTGGTSFTPTSAGANGPNTALTQDFLAISGSGMSIKTGSITLANLTPSQSYVVYLYNGSTAVNRITDYSIVGTTTVSGSIKNVGTVGTAIWTAGTATVPGNYLQLNVAANSTGQLVIKFMNQAAAEGDFAGFQIRAIPEPSTYALLISGVVILILAFRARRRIPTK